MAHCHFSLEGRENIMEVKIIKLQHLGAGFCVRLKVKRRWGGAENLFVGSFELASDLRSSFN
jgi:hypothetical protein